MATSSTCPEVRAWIITELTARLPATVRISRAEPLQSGPESVWLGPSSSGSSEPHGLGPVTIRRSAEYSTQVVFRCRAKVVDGEAETRVFARFAELEELLAEDPKPVIDGLQWLTLRSWEFSSLGGADGGPVVEIIATVAASEHLA